MNCHREKSEPGEAAIKLPRRIVPKRRRGAFDERERKARERGLGDALEDFLTSHGITKEWYQDYKAKHGLLPTCGCNKRLKYLNDLSKAHPNLAKYGVMVFRALTRKPQ